MLTSQPQYGDLNHLKSISWWFYSRKYLWHILALSYLSDITAMVDTIKTSPLTFRVYSYNPIQSPSIPCHYSHCIPIVLMVPCDFPHFFSMIPGFLGLFRHQGSLAFPWDRHRKFHCIPFHRSRPCNPSRTQHLSKFVSKWNANDGGQFRNRLKS